MIAKWVFTQAVPHSSCCTTAVARSGSLDHTEPHYRLSGPIRARDRGRPPEHTQEYRKPYDALVDYLDELDEYGVPADRRVIAALGPRVLRLSAERAAGAHPYNTTPEHTAQAREIIGPQALLLPEHKVVLTTDTGEARAIARKVIADTYNYFALANYVSNWKRLGFTDTDLTRPGSDKFIDALVAYGTPDDIAKGLDEHLRAGANHVVIQVLGRPDKLLQTLAELAGPLGLSR